MTRLYVGRQLYVLTAPFIVAASSLLAGSGNPASGAAKAARPAASKVVRDRRGADPGPSEIRKEHESATGPEGQLRATWLRMFELVDPHLGSVADRPVPGKPSFSRFKDKSVDEDLFFDVGNNAVSASVSARGAIHKALIFTGSHPVARRREKGVWSGYDYLNFCQDTSFSFKTTGAPVEVARKGLHQDTSLILGAFPLTRVDIDNLSVRQMVMAPIIDNTRLRALFVGFYIETVEEKGVRASLIIPQPRKGRTHKGDKEAGFAEFILLDGLEHKPRGDSFEFCVQRGKPAWIPLLLVMGENERDFRRNRARAGDLSSESVMSETTAFFSHRIPEISFSGDSTTPLYSIIRRAICSELIIPLVDGRGRPVGCATGSDTSEPTAVGHFNFVWSLDLLYSFLYAGMISPDTLLYGLQFSMTRSVPHWMPLVDRTDGSVPEKDRRPWSLSCAVVPVVLAGAYYSLTADGKTLAQMEEADPITGETVSLKTAMERLLDALLRTRDEDEPMLFQSRWLSDGHSEGKYHTGSNVLAWYSFHSAARLFREVFADHEKAEEYLLAARRMKEDLRKYCTVEHEGKTMFVEGYKARLMHDGEEAGTTIAPFLGFCAPDDPAMLNYKKFGCSPENPYWDEKAQGIAWYKKVTFPGFLTELAAADTEEEVVRSLQKLRALADVDGQWWWWPIDESDPDRAAVIRNAVCKCGYGTGMFLIQFINTILGVNWDGPTRKLTIKPFVPWEDFDCSGLNVGSLRLDLKYHSGGEGARIQVRHNQDRINELRFIIRAPTGTKDCKMVSSSTGCALSKGAPYYGKPTWEVSISNTSQPQVAVELAWH